MCKQHTTAASLTCLLPSQHWIKDSLYIIDEGEFCTLSNCQLGNYHAVYLIKADIVQRWQVYHLINKSNEIEAVIDSVHRSEFGVIPRRRWKMDECVWVSCAGVGLMTLLSTQLLPLTLTARPPLRLQ